MTRLLLYSTAQLPLSFYNPKKFGYFLYPDHPYDDQHPATSYNLSRSPSIENLILSLTREQHACFPEQVCSQMAVTLQ